MFYKCKHFFFITPRANNIKEGALKNSLPQNLQLPLKLGHQLQQFVLCRVQGKGSIPRYVSVYHHERNSLPTIVPCCHCASKRFRLGKFVLCFRWQICVGFWPKLDGGHGQTSNWGQIFQVCIETLVLDQEKEAKTPVIQGPSYVYNMSQGLKFKSLLFLTIDLFYFIFLNDSLVNLYVRWQFCHLTF